MPLGEVRLPVNGFDAHLLHQGAHLHSTAWMAFHAREITEHSAAGKGSRECSIEGICSARHNASRETAGEQDEPSQLDFTGFGTDGLVLSLPIPPFGAASDPPLTRQCLHPLIVRKIVAAVKARQVYAGWHKPPRFERNLIIIGGSARRSSPGRGGTA